MSTASAASRAARLWQAPIGKKAIMAITGVILYGFTLVHMAANLQFFLGAEKLDAYGENVKAIPALLWGTRGLLLVALVLHVTSALALVGRARAARPQRYKVHKKVNSSYAANSMTIGGLLLLAFIVFHIMHFTTGQAHPAFIEGKVYDNVISGFTGSFAWAPFFYIAAMLALSLHLYHGVWSGFQTLGLNHPKYTPALRTFAKLFAFVVSVGFAAVPIAVIAGVGH